MYTWPAARSEPGLHPPAEEVLTFAKSTSHVGCQFQCDNHGNSLKLMALVDNLVLFPKGEKVFNECYNKGIYTSLLGTYPFRTMG